MKNKKVFATLLSLISVLVLGVVVAGASELNTTDGQPDDAAALGMALPEYYASIYGANTNPSMVVWTSEPAELGTALPEFYASYYRGVAFSQNENVAMSAPTALGTALPEFYASYYSGIAFSQNENVAGAPAALGTILPEYYASYYGGVLFNQAQLAQLESAEGALSVD